MNFSQLVERAGGPLPLAKRLKVGKDWVYRRLSGETPMKEKDWLLIATAMEADEDKPWHSCMESEALLDDAAVRRGKPRRG
jgi:hypothetical protein